MFSLIKSSARRVSDLAARALLVFQIRQIETELSDNIESLPLVEGPIGRMALLARRDELSLQLCRLRGEYRRRFSAPGDVQIYTLA